MSTPFRGPDMTLSRFSLHIKFLSAVQKLKKRLTLRVITSAPNGIFKSFKIFAPSIQGGVYIPFLYLRNMFLRCVSLCYETLFLLFQI